MPTLDAKTPLTFFSTARFEAFCFGPNLAWGYFWVGKNEIVRHGL